MGKESTRVCIYKLKGKKETKLLPCMVVSNRPSQEALLKAVESWNALSSHAWKTKKEMQAWLRTYRAVTDGKHTWGGTVIWTYKEIEHHCSDAEYDALEVPEDIFLMNGSKRRCKRVYDDANCVIHTYFVWYWEDDTLDFYERMSLQNKVIDSYKVDYFTNKVNKIALEELRSGKVKPLQINFE